MKKRADRRAPTAPPIELADDQVEVVTGGVDLPEEARRLKEQQIHNAAANQQKKTQYINKQTAQKYRD